MSKISCCSLKGFWTAAMEKMQEQHMQSWWLLLNDWLLLYPPQVKHLWFQQKADKGRLYVQLPARLKCGRECATLVSPNKGETAVCGFSIYVGWLRGKRSLVLQPCWDNNTGVYSRLVGVKSSDYHSISPLQASPLCSPAITYTLLPLTPPPTPPQWKLQYDRI